MPHSPIIIDGNSLNLERIVQIGDGAPIAIPKSVKKHVDNSERLIRQVAKESKPVYGVNTGFGYFANTIISKKELKDLQLNMIKSHASGYGAVLSPQETRLAMALRLNVLVNGHTGIRWKLCKSLFDLINANIYPIIPEYGSVGASGDLVPLAHLALPIAGFGMVRYNNRVMSAKEALKKAKLSPIKLVEKEGLGLVNGTQIMLSVGGLALAEAEILLDYADRITALTYEAMQARLGPLDANLHQVRNQRGQIESARNILRELRQSYLHSSKRNHPRVQDAYSLRCAPQVHGASRDGIGFARTIVERELNGVTDNPIVFHDQDKIVSGGNFHGQPLAMAFDFAAIALAEIGNISERRLEQLLNPNMSGLSAFLTPEEGIHSGYMAFQYLSANLVNENKLYANPASTDSIPGNVGIEDHVSMGMTAAKKLKKIVENIYPILAVELLAAAQAIDLRGKPKLGTGTKVLYETVRSVVRKLTKDRILSDEVEKAVNLLKEGKI